METSHYHQRFLTEQRDLISWISSLMSQITLGEYSQEISGVEALLMRIEEIKIETNARENMVNSLEVFGKELIRKDTSTTQEVSSRYTLLPMGVDMVAPLVRPLLLLLPHEA